MWGVKTGTSDADYATAKEPITNVSNFLSLLEGFTSILTSPPHPSVSSKIVFENETDDIGYVITHIPKSNRRPFQVINDNDFRYYVRAGSNSQPAPDAFLRSLFGQEPQPNVFLTWGISPAEIDAEQKLTLKVGVMLHNGGENVAKNVNGYVHVGGRDMGLQVNTPNEFAYYTNTISGLKVGFTAKQDFVLGIEQEVMPLIMSVNIKKPITENGIQIIALVSADGQPSHRLRKEISRDELEAIYDNFLKDQSYDVATAIMGKEGGEASED